MFRSGAPHCILQILGNLKLILVIRFFQTDFQTNDENVPNEKKEVLNIAKLMTADTEGAPLPLPPLTSWTPTSQGGGSTVVSARSVRRRRICFTKCNWLWHIDGQIWPAAWGSVWRHSTFFAFCFSDTTDTKVTEVIVDPGRGIGNLPISWMAFEKLKSPERGRHRLADDPFYPFTRASERERNQQHEGYHFSNRCFFSRMKLDFRFQ